MAGKVSWLDEVVQEVMVEARAGGKAAAEGDRAAARAAGRLFAREADEGLETLARRSDALARAAHRAETPSEALLQARFNRLLRPDPETARAFAALAPAERRVVVEMGEAAQGLARRYPGQAEAMVRSLGTEGLAAVRVYGDDVAEVVVKEGPEALGVLRKTGRAGWGFFTGQVLPHKKKLAAAGVLALFLADPDKFIDTAGRATDYAVRQFARAGIDLAGAVGAGAARGLEASIGNALAAYGLNSAVLRYLGMGAAALAVFGSAMVLLGLPVRWMLRPVHLADPDGPRPPDEVGIPGQQMSHRVGREREDHGIEEEAIQRIASDRRPRRFPRMPHGEDRPFLVVEVKAMKGKAGAARWLVDLLIGSGVQRAIRYPVRDGRGPGGYPGLRSRADRTSGPDLHVSRRTISSSPMTRISRQKRIFDDYLLGLVETWLGEFG